MVGGSLAEGSLESRRGKRGKGLFGGEDEYPNQDIADADEGAAGSQGDRGVRVDYDVPRSWVV